MESKAKLLKEQLAFLGLEFDRAGVTYEARKVNTGHMILSFVVDGKPKSLTIGGSMDRNARLRNRTYLRNMLRGTL
jgi:hypothetical protein